MSVDQPRCVGGVLDRRPRKSVQRRHPRIRMRGGLGEQMVGSSQDISRSQKSPERAGRG